jgi:hypothetical protein
VDANDGSVDTLARIVGHSLRVGVDHDQPVVFVFKLWGSKVSAYTAKGEPLWSYDTSDGIDDVWPVDLDGDGVSELIVGLNGFGGVLALGADGHVLWNNRDIGNVWHVTAGPMDDKTLRVLTTSADGDLHVFSVKGEPVSSVNPQCYATAIRLGDRPFIGGSVDEGSVVKTLDPSRWTTTVSKDKVGIGTLAAASSVPWIAVSTTSGHVYAINAAGGAVDGVASTGDRSPDLTWTNTGDSALLISASHRGLTAYRVHGSTN